jgi:anionic cell wall polymer biosynthesis LytR-Cps2A-Psr (LCP) family protein
VGGVTVEVTEDFSLVDPTIPMGTVKLTGQQALNFVRTRKDVGDQLNMTRMERQMTYIRGFSQALKAKHETDATFVLNIYEELKPYVVTDCSGKVLASLLERYATYELGQIVSPKGENVMGQKYYEFHVDETDLQRIMLELFYAPKQ